MDVVHRDQFSRDTDKLACFMQWESTIAQQNKSKQDIFNVQQLVWFVFNFLSYLYTAKPNGLIEPKIFLYSFISFTISSA